MPIRLAQHQIQSIRSHAELCWPLECCGLLAGTLDKEGAREVTQVWAGANGEKKNSAANRYRVEPRDLSDALMRARREGLEIVGVYHSHPAGTAIPSRSDLAHAWRDLAYVIVDVRRGIAGETSAWIVPREGAEFLGEKIVTRSDGEEIQLEP